MTAKTPNLIGNLHRRDREVIDGVRREGRKQNVWKVYTGKKSTSHDTVSSGPGPPSYTRNYARTENTGTTAMSSPKRTSNPYRCHPSAEPRVLQRAINTKAERRWAPTSPKLSEDARAVRHPFNSHPREEEAAGGLRAGVSGPWQPCEEL